MRRFTSVIAGALAALGLTLAAQVALAETRILEGVLEEGDLETSETGQAASYVDFHDVAAEEGDEFRIMVLLESYDPWFLIYDPNGTLIYSSSNKDDELYITLDWKAPGPGTYKFGVAALYKERRQPYRLVIAGLPPGTVKY